MRSGAKGAQVCKRFSWFFYWIQKVQQFANLVDLVKSFQTSISIYLQNGVDTAENRPLKVCQKSANSSKKIGKTHRYLLLRAAGRPGPVQMRVRMGGCAVREAAHRPGVPE